MSLITTLIPAYKTDYLGDVFKGLARQSLQDFRVILSDDSPGGVITDMIRREHWGPVTRKLNLTVVAGPRNARLNHQQLLDLWGGRSPLVHLHLDDDLIYPDFYRAHVAAHEAAPCCVSVSQRWLSQDDGMPAWSLPIPDFVQQFPAHVLQPSTEELFGSTVALGQNWLGEFSNMVMSAEGAAHYPRPPEGDISYYGLLDIGFVLTAAQHLPVTFIREHLGVFRQNAQQTTQHLHTHGGRIGFLAWAAYALAAWRDGHITPTQAVQAIGLATERTAKQFPNDAIIERYFSLLERNASSLSALYEAFRVYWLDLLASQPATAPRTGARSAATPLPA